MGHIRQRISFRSQILPAQHGGCVQLRQLVKADKGGGRNPPRQQGSNSILHSAQSYGVSTQQPSVLHLWSLMALLHQPSHLCSVEQGCTPCWDTCVPDLWSADWESFSRPRSWLTQAAVLRQSSK